MELSFIESKIFTIRNQSVMLDRDLAELYGVETRVLNQAVKRNIDRFPEDFMFRLTESEFQSWKSQIVITLINQSLAELHANKSKNNYQRHRIVFNSAE